MRKDYIKFLKPGETLQSVSLETLRVRKHRAEGGPQVPPAEKKRINDGKKIGEPLDAALFEELKTLEEHARSTYQGEDQEQMLDFLAKSGEILRACNWKKSASQELEDDRAEILDGDEQLPYENRRFYRFFADAMLADLSGVGHRIRLTPELSSFLVKLLTEGLAWINIQTCGNFEQSFLDTINTELKARKNGVETLRPRWEPTPTVPTPEPAKVEIVPKSFTTDADLLADQVTKAAALQSVLEHQRVQWAALEQQRIIDSEQRKSLLANGIDPNILNRS